MLLRFFLFSPLVKLYLNSNFWFLRLNKRVTAVILEMWFTLSMFFPYMLILMIPSMVASGAGMKNEGGWPETLSLIGFNFMMIVLINKDFCKGQSPVHRKLGYQVVDSKTNLPASKVKCMLRNMTAPIWPLEVIFFLAYPTRRLGDFIAGTSLVQVTPTDPESILEDIRNTSLDKDLLLTLVLSITWITLLMWWFNPDF